MINLDTMKKGDRVELVNPIDEGDCAMYEAGIRVFTFEQKIRAVSGKIYAICKTFSGSGDDQYWISPEALELIEDKSTFTAAKSKAAHMGGCDFNTFGKDIYDSKLIAKAQLIEMLEIALKAVRALTFDNVGATDGERKI